MFSVSMCSVNMIFKATVVCIDMHTIIVALKNPTLGIFIKRLNYLQTSSVL